MSTCAVCTSTNIVFLTALDGFNFKQCNNCEFIFLDPMPSQAELNEQYTNKHEEAEPTYDKAGSRLRRAIIKLPRFFPYAFRKNTLDLGCGGGFIAYVLSLIARSSTGVDISENAIAYANNQFKRPKFICMNFTELLETDNKYDFIYSSEIIEHVSDVSLYMRVLQHLVKKNGHVYITTPDLGHPKVPDNIRDWDVFTPPIHVQFFSKKTVTTLFKAYGFEILKFYKNKKPGLIFLSRKIDNI